MRRQWYRYLTMLACFLFAAALSAAAATTPAKEKTHTAKGDVTKVDATAMTFGVKGEGKTAKEEMYSTNAETKWEMKGKAAMMSDLKAGQDVAVTYVEKEGKRVATKVVITDKGEKPEKH